MKAAFTLLAIVVLAASCRTSKQGCPSTNTSGPKYKSSKFEWYKGGR